MPLIGILRGDEVRPLLKRQFNRPAFGSKAVSSCLVVTLTLLADYQRLGRRAQFSVWSLNGRYGWVKQHLWMLDSSGSE